MNYKLYINLFLILSNGICYSQNSDSDCNPIFPKGSRADSDHFTGNVWSYPLVKDDSIYSTVIGNVTFEAGARSNWHLHNAGQILLITAGIGYYQEKGKPIKKMKKGDVIHCPPNVEHWHGATPQSPCTHIAIVPNTEKGIVNWLRPVTDTEYNSYNNN